MNMETNEKYTVQDMLLLMDKLDASIGSKYNGVIGFRKSFESYIKKHSLKQSLKISFGCYLEFHTIRSLLKTIFKCSLSDMPLLINDPFKMVAIAAQWRLEINK